MKKSPLAATAIGFSAIILWSTLALFTDLTHGIPAFQLLFLSFVIAATINALFMKLSGNLHFTDFIAPRGAWLLGVGGLFLYHLFYFNALSHAPVVQAGLIAYLWPLLIVLFSALLPGERLRWFHVCGAVVAFAGAAALILVHDGGGIHLNSQYTIGYLCALACALTWSVYSVASRIYANISSKTTIGFYYAVAVLGLIAHTLSAEVWQAPTTAQWLGIIGLGVGPVGVSFIVWDYGIKHGNIQVLGTLSYCAPLLSTLLLIAFTDAPLTSGIVIGCAGIMLGAVIAVLTPHIIQRLSAASR